MMPAVAQLAAAFGRHGLGTGSRVVLYSIGTPMWATRFWWMLRRSVSMTRRCSTAASTNGRRSSGRSRPAWQRDIARDLQAKPKPGFFVGKNDVAGCHRRPQFGSRQRTRPAIHRGLEPSRYGRPGRIPGSCNVSAATLLDPSTRIFVPLADAEAKFATQGLRKTSA